MMGKWLGNSGDWKMVVIILVIERLVDYCGD